MDIKLPRLAEGVETGTVVSILISEGDNIKKDQAFMELETQKAVGSIPAPDSGKVTKIHVKEGMEVSVGQVLISIAPADASSSAAATVVHAAPSPTAPTHRPQPAAPAHVIRSPETPQQHPEDYHYESKAGVPPPAAPSIRKIARDLGIDLTRIRGSESGGRIVLEDLRAYVQRLQQFASQSRAATDAPAKPSAPASKPAMEAVDFSKWGRIRREKMSALRRTVSQRMQQSWAIPKINQFDDADITELLALRKKYAYAIHPESRCQRFA